jgi:hypothetical protein
MVAVAPEPWPARLASQLLTDPTGTDPVAVVRHLLAVQAQDPRAMRLAVRSRTTGLTAADVDRALGDGRLVVSWLLRHTLHLVTADDFWWLHHLTAPRWITWNRTRLGQEGVSPDLAERGVGVVVETLADGPATRAELRARLDATGVPTAGQALVHVLFAASLVGEAVRGPVVGGELAFVSPRTWIGPEPTPLDPDEALARLGARYLAGHGPADGADLQKWTGLPLTACRRALQLAGPRESPSPDHLPAPRLLGGFDPILHGWADRTGITGSHKGIVTVNGLFRPIALVGGRAVAIWTMPDRRVSIEPLEPIDPETLAALEADAADVERFLAPTG